VFGSMWPKQFGGTPPEHCDAFHDLILIDEISRCGKLHALPCPALPLPSALPPAVLSTDGTILSHPNRK
jgi:hypothetical protein